MVSKPLSGRAVQFGEFELDLEAQQLRKAGVLVRLQPHPFQILAALIRRAGRVVTREELRHEIWGDETFVDFDQGLNFCIRQIRVMLGDEAQTPRYIETIPRRGYRFIAPVSNGEQGAEPVLSPTSESLPTPLRGRTWKVWLAAGLLFGAIATFAYLWKMHSQRQLIEKSTIVLLDFENSTGEKVFDHTLKQGLSVQLEQSPFLNLLSDRSAQETLKMMGLPQNAPLTLEVGRQVCQRTGSAAVIAGTIESVGTRYVLSVAATDCRTGASLGHAQVQADRKEDVLKALGSASTRLREKLGESLSSIQKFDKPIEQATTPSLEALQYYSLAIEALSHQGALASVPYFKRAIQLDPNFALAHARLGVQYGNLGEVGAAELEFKKGIALSEHVSEREKLYLTGHYYDMTGQKELQIQTYEAYSRLYPRDPIPHGNAGWQYGILGRFDKALEHDLEGVRLAPDSAVIASELARTYAALGRLEEAKAVLTEAQKHAPDSWLLHLDMSNIALAQKDSATREREDAGLRATPEGTLNLLYRDAALAASHGQLHNCQKLYVQALQIALNLQLKDNASFAMARKAEYESYLRDPSQAKKSATAALQMTEMYDSNPPVAIAMATAGGEQRAEMLIQAFARHYPDDTLNQFVWGPTVRAIISLNHGKADEAIQTLGVAVPYDRAILESRLVRANAFLAAKHAEEAQAEYRNIVNLRYRFPDQPACALAQLGLARAYALAGDRSRSRDAYKDFLTLWKDADSGSSILKEAKVEFAQLQ